MEEGRVGTDIGWALRRFGQGDLEFKASLGF